MNGNRWRRVGFGVGGLIALAVLVPRRRDAVERGLARHAPGSDAEQALHLEHRHASRCCRSLKEPVNLYFYFSRDAAAKQSPLIMPYAARVREFLEEIAARAGGKIHLQVIDPQPFSDDEDRAAEFGLQSLHGRSAAIRCTLDWPAPIRPTAVQRSPVFRPDREEFLEYDVAKLIQELGTPKKPVIGLMSSIGIAGTIQSRDRTDGRALAHLHAAAAAVHGAHLDARISIISTRTSTC